MNKTLVKMDHSNITLLFFLLEAPYSRGLFN